MYIVSDPHPNSPVTSPIRSCAAFEVGIRRRQSLIYDYIDRRKHKGMGDIGFRRNKSFFSLGSANTSD